MRQAPAPAFASRHRTLGNRRLGGAVARAPRRFYCWVDLQRLEIAMRQLLTAELLSLPVAVQGPAAGARTLAADDPVLRRIWREGIEPSPIEQRGQVWLAHTTLAVARALSLGPGSRWT